MISRRWLAVKAAPTGAREARPKARLEGVTPEAMARVSHVAAERTGANFRPDSTPDWTVDSQSAAPAPSHLGISVILVLDPAPTSCIRGQAPKQS